VFIGVAMVLYHMVQFRVSPAPKPRWKVIFLCAAASALGSLSGVVRTGAPWHWAFLIFGTTMMIVALVVIKPRNEMLR
jgi:hypothetical protein